MSENGPSPAASPDGLFANLKVKLRGESLRAIFHNTGWVLTEKVTRALLSALVSAWVARHLGPEHFSTIAYALTIAAFLGPFSQLGLSSIIVRDLAREPDNAAEILGTTLLLRACAGLVCMLGAVLFLLATETDLQTRLVGVLIAAQLLFQASDAIDYWFQSRLESRFGVRSRMVVSFAVAGLKVALILLKMPLWTFALAISLEFGLVALAMVAAYRHHHAAPNWRYSKRRARKLLIEGSSFLLSAIAITTYMRFDQFLIRHLVGPYGLGLYAAVVPFAQVWQILPLSVITSLAPVIAREAEKGEAAYYRALRAMFVLLGVASLAISLGILLFAGLAVRLFLGPAYQEAVPVLQVYAFTNVSVALGLAWNVWVSNSGKGRLLVLNTVVGGIVSILANFILIPRFGIMGAAVAANLSFVTSALLMNFFTCRKIFFMQLGIMPRLGSSK